MEWNNLAGNPEYASTIQQLAGWLPNKNVEDIPE
jgi:hypothetical protein